MQIPSPVTPDKRKTTRYTDVLQQTFRNMNMKTPEAYYARAREMFFTAHPDFQSALDELTESDARAANLSLRQLREWHAERIYAAFLRQKNLDGMIFSIQLAEPDKAVAAEAIETYLKSHAESLGMSWEEFCIKNEL